MRIGPEPKKASHLKQGRSALVGVILDFVPPMAVSRKYYLLSLFSMDTELPLPVPLTSSPEGTE